MVFLHTVAKNNPSLGCLIFYRLIPKIRLRAKDFVNLCITVWQYSSGHSLFPVRNVCRSEPNSLETFMALSARSEGRGGHDISRMSIAAWCIFASIGLFFFVVVVVCLFVCFVCFFFFVIRRVFMQLASWSAEETNVLLGRQLHFFKYIQVVLVGYL